MKLFEHCTIYIESTTMKAHISIQSEKAGLTRLQFKGSDLKIQENLRLFHVFVKRLKSATYHGFFTKGQLIALMCNFFRALFFAVWQKCVVLFHTKTITASFYNFFSFEMSRIKSFVYAKRKLYFSFLLAITLNLAWVIKTFYIFGYYSQNKKLEAFRIKQALEK